MEMPHDQNARFEEAERRYSARAAIPHYADVLRTRAQLSASVRQASGAFEELSYGTSALERIDFYPADGLSRGCLVFFHGGYWKAQDKSDYAFIVRNLNERGIAVALPNYDLCPSVSLTQIVRQATEATRYIYHHLGDRAPPQPMAVGGVSAGGHLAAMLACTRWSEVDNRMRDDALSGAVCISGLYDLRPLLDVRSVNDAVRLTESEVATCSPAYRSIPGSTRLYLAVGSEETDGFKDQFGWAEAAWGTSVALASVLQGKNHFDILLDYLDPESELYRMTVEAVLGTEL